MEPLRRVNSRGGLAPHLFVRFDSHLFCVDTSRSPKACVQPDAYLITHAHSDHYGKSAMLSPRALASKETARALEIRYDKEYKGRTFSVGESVLIGDVEVKTYPTGHTIGATAFYWETEVGTRILATGDVKDYSHLPRCDFLITEANYGDPWDPSCIFEDDLGGFFEALQSGASFGAYAFGKAQRAVALMRAMGYDGEIVKNRAYSYYPGPEGFRKAVLSYANVGATSLFTTVEDLSLWAMNFENPVVGDRNIVEEMEVVEEARGLAEAEAPARPVPTTMMSNLRLFAGLTSFISNLCRSHFSGSGPAGAFESSRFDLAGPARILAVLMNVPRRSTPRWG